MHTQKQNEKPTVPGTGSFKLYHCPITSQMAFTIKPLPSKELQYCNPNSKVIHRIQLKRKPANTKNLIKKSNSDSLHTTHETFFFFFKDLDSLLLLVPDSFNK